jgi:mercuric ion binding protein
MNKTLFAIGLMFIAGHALAATRTVVLSVPGMNCAVCPITVKKALAKVPGVSRAEADYARRSATVTFDDARTSVEQLTRATRDAGYPSSLDGTAK